MDTQANPDGRHRSRLSRARQGRIVMTPLKRRALTAAFLGRITRGSHFDPLFASVKTRNQCLRRLTDFDYLERVSVPTTPFGAPLYRVTRTGAQIASVVLADEGLDLDDDEIRAIRRRPLLSDHALRTADVYAALCLRKPPDCGANVALFLPEPLVRVEYEVRVGSGQTWRRRCFAPDGGIVIEAGGETYAIALEIDMATVEMERFAAKCQSFAHVASAGLKLGRAGLAPSALAVVTTSEKRLVRLKSVTERQKCPPIVFGTFDEVARDGIGIRWAVAGSDRRATLAEIAGEI